MKRFIPLICICGTLMLVTVTVSAETPGRSVDVPGIPYSLYHAFKIAEVNPYKVFPSLDYWGLAGAEWGMTRTELAAAASLLATKEHVELAGLPCRVETVFDSRTGGLTAIRKHFGDKLTTRFERVGQYHKIKKEVMENYHAPTDNIRPDEVYRGEDVYVQGLEQGYLVEWRGPETVVSLHLSDEILFLEYRQSSTSQAIAQRRKVEEARKFVEGLPLNRDAVKE